MSGGLFSCCLPSSSTITTTSTKNNDSKKSELNYTTQASTQNLSSQQSISTFKLLLIGAGESGKTTFMRQMMQIHQGGFSTTYVKQMRPQILSNVIEGAYATIKASSRLQHEIVNPDAVEAANLVCLARDSQPSRTSVQELDEAVAKAIIFLCKDPGFVETLEESSKYQILDGWFYFADRIREYPAWGGSKWMPDAEDILHARIRTLGVHREKFQIDGNNYEIVDVGGQRSERKKWIAQFQGVHGVIFMQSLSEYDQMLFEDDTKNRLLESLELWKKNVNNPAFKHAAILLFLNKVDLLIQKFCFKQIPIPDIFGFKKAPPKFNASLTMEQNEAQVFDWFKEIFRSLVVDKKRKNVWVYKTSALDKDTVQRVINSCCKQVVETSLQEAGAI